MKVGAIFSQADGGTDPEMMRRYARDLESAGFAHLMAYDHLLGASAERLSGGEFGGFGTPPYTDQHTFQEILVLFSHLAAVTDDLEFVTSVVVLPQRQAAAVAKQVATIDLLSGGRLRLAVGVGWNWAEYEALGADFGARTEVLEEQIEVMRALWTQPLVTFHGAHHRLDGVGINPRPARPIPIWIGTKASTAALRRVVRLADGWMPLLLPGIDEVDLATGVRRIRQLCEEAGRDPATLPIHGRVYLGDGWQGEVEQAIELGFSDLSVGVNRLAHPGLGLDFHLRALLEVKPELDALVR
ncbi:MAG: LLM class F420-dependent oxidoreductase [Actinobacteria bacterium]|nr:LLM class F420-dependent oxidoreductase [Actinomycetota bacterium]